MPTNIPPTIDGPNTATTNWPRRLRFAAAACAIFWVLYFGSFASAATIVRNDVTDETMSSGSDWQDAMTLSGTATVVGAWMYCSAPDTLEDYLHADASMVSLRDNGLVNTRGTFKSSVDVSLSSGWNWVEFDTITTGDGDLSDVTEFFPSVSADISANCLYGRSTSNQIQGQSGAAGAGKDLAFGIADGAGFDPGDPTEDPVADVILPTATTYTSLTPVPLRFGTFVCTLEYAGETPKAIYSIETDDGGWTAYHTGLLSYAGFTVDPDARCDPGLAYGWQSSMPVTTPTGDYRVRVKASFDDGATYGDWSDWTEFTVSNDAYGGGGGGSWDGSGSGSASDWATMLDGLPTHDEAYGACSIIGDPELGFSGASWTFADGDGMACVLSWVRYILIPDAESAIDFVTAPLNVLSARWPFVYFTKFAEAFEQGVTTATECPLPDMLGDELMGVTLPSADLCDMADAVTTAATSNETATTYIVIGLWVGFVGESVYAARAFFMP